MQGGDSTIATSVGSADVLMCLVRRADAAKVNVLERGTRWARKAQPCMTWHAKAEAEQ